MGWQGMSANLMCLGGLVIAVGMVVDASIVVTENIARHMAETARPGLSRMEVADAGPAGGRRGRSSFRS